MFLSSGAIAQICHFMLIVRC